MHNLYTSIYPSVHNLYTSMHKLYTSVHLSISHTS